MTSLYNCADAVGSFLSSVHFFVKKALEQNYKEKIICGKHLKKLVTLNRFSSILRRNNHFEIWLPPNTMSRRQEPDLCPYSLQNSHHLELSLT